MRDSSLHPSKRQLAALAQICRLSYSDSGIINEYILGGNLGIENKKGSQILTEFDSMIPGKRGKYAHLRTSSVSSQPGEPGSPHSNPMESYSIRAGTGKNPYGAYLTSPNDCVALMVSGKVFKKGLFDSNDLVLAFKGTNTLDNLITDLLSQLVPIEFSRLAGNPVKKEFGYVPRLFAHCLMELWPIIIKAVNQFAKGGRLFITGHSLGGAFATYCAIMMAEMKLSGSLNKQIKSIHLITFGAPRTFSAAAKKSADEYLLKGLLTFDRVLTMNTPMMPSISAMKLMSFFNSGLIFNTLSFLMDSNDAIGEYPIGYHHLGDDSINLIEVPGEGKLSRFSAHLDYLGMHFAGIWRLEGMKDPVKRHLGYFLLGKDGVKFKFLEKKGTRKLRSSGERTTRKNKRH